MQDGDLDLFIGSAGSHGSSLFVNNGQGAFTEVTGSAVSGTVYSHAPIFVDMDGDNDLDLLCANWGTGTDDETCTPGVS